MQTPLDYVAPAHALGNVQPSMIIPIITSSNLYYRYNYKLNRPWLSFYAFCLKWYLHQHAGYNIDLFFPILLFQLWKVAVLSIYLEMLLFFIEIIKSRTIRVHKLVAIRNFCAHKNNSDIIIKYD